MLNGGKKYLLEKKVYENDKFIKNVTDSNFLSKSFSVSFLSFSKNGYVKKPSDEYKNVQLKLFEFLDTSTMYIKSGVLFMGGSIQALAWNNSNTNTNNILAVASYPDYCWFHNVTDQYRKVAFLTFVVFEEVTEVVETNVLFVDFAPVHSIKWAPCNFFNQNVIAVSGNDSTVRLLKIDLNKRQKRTNYNVLDGCEIIAELTPIFNNVRALVFDWMETFPFDIVVVGYSNGFICVFDIKTKKSLFEKKLSPYPISSISISKTKKSFFVTMFDDRAVMVDFTDISNVTFTEHETRYASKSSWPISLSNPLLIENLPKLLSKGQLKILNTSNENVSEFQTMENYGQFGRFTSVDTCDFSGFGCATTDDGNIHLFNLNYNFACEEDTKKAYLMRFFSCAKNFARDKKVSKKVNEFVSMLQDKSDMQWESVGDVFSDPEKLQDWLRPRLELLYEVPTEFTMPESFFVEPKKPMNPGRRAANYIEKKGLTRQLFYHSLYMNCCALNKSETGMGMLAAGGSDGFLHVCDLSFWQKTGKF